MYRSEGEGKGRQQKYIKWNPNANEKPLNENKIRLFVSFIHI